MKKYLIPLLFMFFVSVPSHAGTLDDLFKGLESTSEKVVGKKGLDESTVVSGLKEALSIGTGHAVVSTSRIDGYFKNQLIKIMLPEKVQTAANILGQIGCQKQVDDFILSMNRAAENAAPVAKRFFIDAVKAMTIDDGMKILGGHDTAATEYFKSNTSGKLYEAFRPTVSKSMKKVGVTRSYQEMVGTYTSRIPFANVESVDLDHYVTTKALDGLFYMVGEEEKNIRTNPAARVTDLLRTVFGK